MLLLCTSLVSLITATSQSLPATPLDRVIALNLTAVTLHQALDSIQARGHIELNFVPSEIDQVSTTITLHDPRITVRQAIDAVLAGSHLHTAVTPTGRILIIESATPSMPSAAQPTVAGTIRGRVTEALNARPLRSATVVLDGSRTATTSDSGTFQFRDVFPGNHTVVVRVPGFIPVTRALVVHAGEDATADVALTSSPSQLDQVVVTGTVVPTEVRAVPTPVTVVTAADIAALHPGTVQELFRQVVPSGVSWVQPNSPDLTSFSTRGSSTLSVGSGQMKVYIDGIEVADPTTAAIDPNSIERIEVIRGPQAAAIYGSDAIGGVIAVFTKRGSEGSTHPTINAEASVGDQQTPYPGFKDVVRQQYKASMDGGTSDLGYNIGGSYSSLGPYVPNGEISRQYNPSVFGGIHYSHGPVDFDLSARQNVWNESAVYNPDLLTSGFSYFSKPNYLPITNTYQSVGARLTVTPVSWWVSTMTLGLDRSESDETQTRPRLTSPADTELLISTTTEERTSTALTSSVSGQLATNVTGTITVGVEHWTLPIVSYYTSGALTTDQTVQTDPGFPLTLDRTTTNNTGEFVQGQLGLFDAVFLTGGVRAEQNSDFGDSLSSPVSPRVGVSVVRSIGGATLKFRGSYGSAIRPPPPGGKLGSNVDGIEQVANPNLGPERQSGFDGGTDVVFGTRGALSVSYFNQIAKNLIQGVQLASNSSGELVEEYENVGRVHNTGVEVEGSLALGILQVKAQYAYVSARLEALAPGYTGELQVGDQTEDTPHHTAGVSMILSPLRGTTVTGGLTYVGTYDAIDDLAYFRCLGGTGPCLNSTYTIDQHYLVGYPAFFKVNASITQQLTRLFAVFVSVDNLTNNDVHEYLNLNPVMGRLTTVGLRLRY
jgi:outer membrane receptor protein involved in Fe transport